MPVCSEVQRSPPVSQPKLVQFQFQLGDVVPVDSAVQRSPPMSQWLVQQGVQTKGHGTKGHRTKGHRQKATRQKATGQKATERNVKMLLSYQDVLERLRVVFFKK